MLETNRETRRHLQTVKISLASAPEMPILFCPTHRDKWHISYFSAFVHVTGSVSVTGDEETRRQRGTYVEETWNKRQHSGDNQLKKLVGILQKLGNPQKAKKKVLLLS